MESAVSSAGSSVKANLTTLLFGAALAAGGSWMVYFYGYRPWDGAVHGAPTVTLSVKGLMMGPLAASIGIVMLISLFMPTPPAPAAGDPPRRNLLGAVLVGFIVVSFVAGVVGYFWLRTFLKASGYEV